MKDYKHHTAGLLSRMTARVRAWLAQRQARKNQCVDLATGEVRELMAKIATRTVAEKNLQDRERIKAEYETGDDHMPAFLRKQAD